MNGCNYTCEGGVGSFLCAADLVFEYVCFVCEGGIKPIAITVFEAKAKFKGLFYIWKYLLPPRFHISPYNIQRLIRVVSCHYTSCRNKKKGFQNVMME